MASTSRTLGAVTGLNDSTTVSYAGIRYVSPNGGLIPLPGGKFGLFFGAGNCIDADSDSFHAIAYAESNDSTLTTWTVYNGINNPIISRPTAAFTDQATNTQITVPANCAGCRRYARHGTAAAFMHRTRSSTRPVTGSA